MGEIKNFEKFEAKKKVFLGGTCAESTWRNDLILKLKIDYFDPVVDDWNEEAQQKELEERENCDFCLYVITPRMKGVYSIAEVVDDSNKRPEKTVFAYLKTDNGYKNGEIIEFPEEQLKSLKQVAEMIKRNGGECFENLDDVANFLNNN